MIATGKRCFGVVILLGALFVGPQAVAGMSCDPAKDGGCFVGAQLGSISPKSSGDYSNSTGFGLGFGIRASCFLGVLFGLDDLGSFDIDADSTYVIPEGRRAAQSAGRRIAAASVSGNATSADAKGLSVAVMGVLPLNPRWQLFGIAGAMYWRQSVDLDDFGKTSNETATGLSPTVSGGIQVLIGDAKKWGVQLNARRIFNVGDKDKTGFEADYDSISLGVTYHLGGVTSPK